MKELNRPLQRIAKLTAFASAVALGVVQLKVDRLLRTVYYHATSVLDFLRCYQGQASWLRRAPLLICALAVLSFAGCANESAVSLEGKPLSGYVRMNEVQAAYIGSGNAGSGTLSYHGRTYPFNVGGLGVGGIGISKINATGEVYGLQRLSDFAGVYVEARYGFALVTKSAGELWLQNRKGVVMHLKAKREGLMLTLGGDAVVIAMNQ